MGVVTLNLAFPVFGIDIPTVDAWMEANAGDLYAGYSTNTQVQIHWTDDPGSTIIAVVKAYWAALNTGSPEATKYTTNQIAAANKAKIAAGITFGNNLLAQFTSENMNLGIEEDDMVDSVLTTVTPVLTALQTGSLTAAIKRIKAIPSGSYDSTFVTPSRLLNYCNQIELFLGIMLSTSL